MMLLAAPMYVLFESSIWIIVAAGKIVEALGRNALTASEHAGRSAGTRRRVSDPLRQHSLRRVAVRGVGRAHADRRHRRSETKAQDFYWQNYTPVLARLDPAPAHRQHLPLAGLHRDHRADPDLDDGRTFRRVIPARLPALRPVKIDKIPLHATIHGRRRRADVRARVQQFFAARGWQIRKREFGGEEWSFIDKHNWARRGVLVAHVGFVIIAAGTTIYWATRLQRPVRRCSRARRERFRKPARRSRSSSSATDQPVATKSGTRLSADRLRFARDRHRQRRRPARCRHSRQPAL